MQYPIIGIVGRRGFGKTLFATALAIETANEGYPVFANYKLKGIKSAYISLTELAELPPQIHDCLVIMDEFHMGADAYDFFTKRTRSLTKFVTQLRKRRVTFVFTTQYMEQVAKRIRTQTDYIIMVRPEAPRGSGIFSAYVRDPHLPYEEQIINCITENFTEVFGYYDTSEIIDADGISEDDLSITEDLDNEMIEVFQNQST